MTSYGQFKRQMKNWQDDIKFIEKIIEKKYARSISILQEISAVDILYHAAPHEQNFYNTDNTAPDDTRRNEWRCWFLQQTRAQEAIEKTVSEIRKELAEIESRLRGIAASAKN